MDIHVQGPRTMSYNDKLLNNSGSVYVDSSGFVVFGGKRFNGDGSIDD
jgi:hypothetical protein